MVKDRKYDKKKIETQRIKKREYRTVTVQEADYGRRRGRGFAPAVSSYTG